jgi:hypothetical protein
VSLRMESLPYTRRVGAVIDRWHTGGRLTVQRGRVIFTPSSVAAAVSDAAEMVHVIPEITIVQARLMPPWMGSSFVLRDGMRKINVVVPSLGIAPLIDALRAAGFAVHQRRTWLARWQEE